MQVVSIGLDPGFGRSAVDESTTTVDADDRPVDGLRRRCVAIEALYLCVPDVPWIATHAAREGGYPVTAGACNGKVRAVRSGSPLVSEVWGSGLR